MGQTTFAQFRSRLSRALGDRNLGPSPLGDWVNDGYFDMTGAYDFIELRTVATATIAADEDAIETPEDLQWIRGLMNVADEEELSKLSSEYIHALDASASSNARIRHYSRDGDGIYIRPAYTEDKELTLLYNREPAKLEDDSDTTVTPTTFDRAVHLFALYSALSDLGEENRAAHHRNNAILHLRSRIDPDEREFAPGKHRGAVAVRTLKEFRRTING